jgi:hypothetical protein
VYDKTKNLRILEAISYEFNEERSRVRADLFEDDLAANTTIFLTEFRFSSRDDTEVIFTHDVRAKTCKKETRNAPHEHLCFRDNTRRVRHIVLGGRLHASVLTYQTADRAFDIVASHERRGRPGPEEHCIPISGATFEHQRNVYSFDSDIRFFDIRLGIGNQAIFELPDSCRGI